MVSSQSYYFSCIVTLLFFLLLSVVQYTLAAPTPHYCRHDQRDALLEFRHEFPGNVLTLDDYSNGTISFMFSSWNKSSDCCSWEGVKCDAKSGEVISLVLYNSILNSSLKTNSSLFKLQYLQSLTISGCYLYGEIPFSLGNLSSLTSLDLSSNMLVGQVPASLGNLAHLKRLSLWDNKLVGQVPASLGNLSHLRSLDLSYNQLVGQIPASLGNLSHLTYLILSSNQLVGQVPASLGNLPHLKRLSLSNNKLVGQVPASLGKLLHLTNLDLGDNKLGGQVPISLGNLTQLNTLRLSNNNFTSNVPVSFANLAKLADLDIRNNRFTSGKFCFFLPNLTSLSFLYISSNNFHSKFPPDMSGLHNLESLDARENSFSGPFPKSLFNIPSLSLVYLGGNQFKGPIEFGNISSSSRLEYLGLADNDFTGSIPRSISKLSKLDVLDLSNNNLEGQVPGCLRRLGMLELSYNAFTSFGKSWEAPDDSTMQQLRLNLNSFQGPFPHWICNLRYLDLLDLSNNFFNGSIPPCLRNSTSSSFRVLVLRNNSFSGILLPDIFVDAIYLRVLDVSHNQLEGKLPRSLINCTSMQLLNVGRNRIKDEFPSWLGSLPSLKVLLLRSNQFHGLLYHRHVSFGIQSLSVIDVSDNDFTGTLPPFYFSKWLQMTRLGKHADDDSFNFGQYVGMIRVNHTTSLYNSSMEMVNKGVELEFDRIHKDFKAIDFSGNRLWGNIPESIGLLKGLHLLNLSGNAFTGNIPPSLENLTNLEALDLSRNRLSGQIPRGLGKLSSLSSMNFSCNNLEGPIPRGQQFQSQDCSSFMNNTRLSGLEDICVKPHVSNSTPQGSEEFPEPEEQVINWLAAAIAYGPGVLCGLVIGHIYASDGHIVKFGRNKSRVVTTRAR